MCISLWRQPSLFEEGEGGVSYNYIAIFNLVGLH